MCHSKYVVTPKAWYISTQNFTPDYLLHNWTVGASIHVDVTPDMTGFTLQDVFDRDWASPFAHPIESYSFNLTWSGE